MQALADQGLSSLTNFGTSLVAARLTGPERFGSIAVALSLAYMAMIVGRALVGEPLLATLGAATGRQRHEAEQGAVMTAFAVGVLAAVGAWAASSVPWPALRDCWLVAFWIPSLLVQDATRYAAFSRLRPAIALASDLAWAIVQVGFAGLLLVTGSANGAGILAAWGIGASAGAVIGLALLRITARGSAFAWIRSTGRYSRWLVPQLTLGQFCAQVTMLVVAAFFGTTALGGIRAMVTLSMPIFVLLTASQAIAVPALVRVLIDGGPRPFIRRVRTWSVYVTAAASIAAVTAVLMAKPLTALLFGTKYLSYSSFVLPFAIGAALQAWALLPSSGLRALYDSRSIFVVQVAASVITLGAVLVAAVFSTPYWSAWAMASQGLVAATLSWLAFRRSCRRARDRKLSRFGWADRLVAVP